MDIEELILGNQVIEKYNSQMQKEVQCKYMIVHLGNWKFIGNNFPGSTTEIHNIDVYSILTTLTQTLYLIITQEIECL